MIGDLTAAWALFAPAWLTAWLAAPLLALVGVAAVARGQVFLGAAMAQAAAAGVAAALALAAAGTAWLAGAEALGAIAGAAAAAALAGRRAEDGAVAWIYVAAGAAAVLAVAPTPHGAAEIQRLLASSVIGADAVDAAITGGLLTAVAAAAWRWGDRLRAVLLDPEVAAAQGIDARRWSWAMVAAQAAAVGWCLHATGAVFTVGMLVLPALAARRLAATLAGTAGLAAAIAIAASLAGTVAAHLADLPPGQVIVALAAAAALLPRRRAAPAGAGDPSAVRPAA